MARQRKNSRAAGNRRMLVGAAAVTLVGGSLLAQVLWAGAALADPSRSEERRVGKECLE